jgi:hypothetical protein
MRIDKDRTTRQQYAARREARAAWREERAEANVRREQATVDALARYAPRRRHEMVPTCPSDSVRVVLRRAPRLGVGPYPRAIERLLTVSAFSHDWVPRGRGRDTLFRSLAEHQLARYATPSFLWSVFFDPYVEDLVPLVVHVAAGGSLFAYVRDCAFAIPLTRRMCHELLSTPFRGSLLQAIRRVQVRSVGGDDRLLHVWWRTRVAQRVGTHDEESFWYGVLHWLARASMLDPVRVGPLVDYVAQLRERDASFSIAGRSVAALLRGMDEWHRNLAREQLVRGTVFQPSGFEPLELEVKQRGPAGAVHRAVWRVGEILSSKDLLDEGRRMNHCVYSYARSIESGQTSIWSMTLEDGQGATGHWVMLTIEVRNELRRVVQARGRFNSPATKAAHEILVRWAGLNGLTITL